MLGLCQVRILSGARLSWQASPPFLSLSLSCEFWASPFPRRCDVQIIDNVIKKDLDAGEGGVARALKIQEWGSVSCWSCSYQHYLFQFCLLSCCCTSRMGLVLLLSSDWSFLCTGYFSVCYMSRPSDYFVFNHLYSVVWILYIMNNVSHYTVMSTSYLSFLLCQNIDSSAIFSKTEPPHKEVLPNLSDQGDVSVFSIHLYRWQYRRNYWFVLTL